MRDYVMVVDDVVDDVGNGGASLFNHLVVSLANAGWLVTVATNQTEVRRSIDRNGTPHLIVFLATTQEAVRKALNALQSVGTTRTLAIVRPADPDQVKQAEADWMQFDDFVIWRPAEESDARASAEATMRVRRLLSQNPGDAGQAAHVAGQPASARRRLAPLRASADVLSPTERRIVRMLEASGGQPVSVEQLAQCVLGVSHESRAKSVRAHIARLRKKIETNPAVPLQLITIRNVGYRLNAQQPPQDLAP